MRVVPLVETLILGALVGVKADENQYPQGYPQPIIGNPYQQPGGYPYPQNYQPAVFGPRIGGPIWRPQIGQKVQVILDRRVIKLDPYQPLVPAEADIWDLDLFDTPKETIDVLHSKGKRVLCYLSVGGSESWRPDFNQISPSDMGDIMPKWKGERYLNLRSPTVWRFMQNRIRMAYEKGCDAIDPDNVDPFNDDFDRGGGFNPKLTPEDSINYVKRLSAEAHRYGMAMGMKNAETILPNITDVIEFAVNEECSTYEEGCKQYVPLIKAGKPVFHFEYVTVDNSAGYPNIKSIYPNLQNLGSRDILDYYCLRKSFGNPDFIASDIGVQFNTAVKLLDLGGWVMYCDGRYGETPTAQTTDRPDEGSGSRGSRGFGGRNPSSSEGSSGSGSRPWWDPFGIFSG